MDKFIVKIEETYRFTVEVEAENREKAKNKANNYCSKIMAKEKMTSSPAFFDNIKSYDCIKTSVAQIKDEEKKF